MKDLGQPANGVRAAFQGLLLLWGILYSAHSQEIPVGFKIERYASIWQRNPFGLANPIALNPSRLAQLDLTSWLIVGSNEMISVEDSGTRRSPNYRCQAQRKQYSPSKIAAKHKPDARRGCDFRRQRIGDRKGSI